MCKLYVYMYIYIQYVYVYIHICIFIHIYIYVYGTLFGLARFNKLAALSDALKPIHTTVWMPKKPILTNGDVPGSPAMEHNLAVVAASWNPWWCRYYIACTIYNLSSLTDLILFVILHCTIYTLIHIYIYIYMYRTYIYINM